MTKLFKRTLCLLILVLSGQSLGSVDVIYEEDNRKEIYEVKDPKISVLSQSVGRRVHTSQLKSLDEKLFEITAEKVSLEEGLGLCLDQNFSDQISVGDCSGFLVAPDLLVTAGHCMADEGEIIYDQNNFFCSEFKWVFDYKMKDNKNLAINLAEVPRNEIYECESVIHAANFDNLDIALIKLKRSANNRSPLKIDINDSAKVGDSVFMLGHPIGLPMKYTDTANVFNVTSSHFATNLDSFGGNSGSPVFNQKTGEVIGVAVRGMIDFQERNEQTFTCQEVNVCDLYGENCDISDPDIQGEHASYLSVLKDFLNI